MGVTQGEEEEEKEREKEEKTLTDAMNGAKERTGNEFN